MPCGVNPYGMLVELLFIEATVVIINQDSL